MYPASDRRLDQETLMKQLNALLASLHLPIPLISPTDLTPRLLVAILESLMGVRLPITFNNEPKNSKRRSTHIEKVQAMKIFLGVLETDFLQTDVGLSDLDPRRLADGEWEEVLFIAELLCWIGRRAGLVSADDMDVIPQEQQKQRLSPKSQLDLDAESLFQSSSTMTGIERLSERTFSPFLKEKGGDSVTSVEDQDEESTISDIHSFHYPFAKPPRCIHELPSPSLLFSVHPKKQSNGRTSSPDHNNQSFCNCHPSIADTLPIEHDHPNTQSQQPVRTTGFIQLVDEEAELASFESSHSMSFRREREEQHSDQSRDYLQTGTCQKAASILAVHEQYTHTVHLLNERARLLTQLEDFKNSQPP